jgi:hypothetical protein
MLGNIAVAMVSTEARTWQVEEESLSLAVAVCMWYVAVLPLLHRQWT